MSEIPSPREIVFNESLPLLGKNIIVTGGSRDIGAGIVKDLAGNGANILAVYRDPKKHKRVIEVQNATAAMDGGVEFYLVDITNKKARKKVLRESRLLFGPEIDALVLNAAGRDRNINVDANIGLVDLFLPALEKAKGKIVLMQSLAGHHYPELRRDGYIDETYIPVARTKYEGERNLRSRRRISELNERGVRLITVVAPLVKDTFNARYYSRMSALFAESSEKIAERYGVPKTITIEQVSKNVSELLIRHDLPQDYVEDFRSLF